MAKTKQVSGLDLNQDVQFQQREWRFQRVAWVLMALILLAALLGVFGQGPLAHTQIDDPTGILSVKYDRFDRYHAPTGLDIIVAGNAAPDDKVALVFSRDFVDRIRIDRIDPEPEATRSSEERIVYEFTLGDRSRPAHILFDYEYEQFGSTDIQIGLEGGPELQLSAFVYP